MMWKEFSTEQLRTLHAIFRRSRVTAADAPDRGERFWDWVDDAHSTPSAASNQGGQAPGRNPALSTVDLFDLRQTVMRYTNPLRAKILLFSLLHYSYRRERTEQAFLLKGYELDKLLERMLQTYDQLPVLTVQLKKIARRLDNPLEYTQTATAILRAVKPLYEETPPVAAPLEHSAIEPQLRT
jgi:hypothetical protein